MGRCSSTMLSAMAWIWELSMQATPQSMTISTKSSETCSIKSSSIPLPTWTSFRGSLIGLKTKGRDLKPSRQQEVAPSPQRKPTHGENTTSTKDWSTPSSRELTSTSKKTPKKQGRTTQDHYMSSRDL